MMQCQTERKRSTDEAYVLGVSWPRQAKPDIRRRAVVEVTALARSSAFLTRGDLLVPQAKWVIVKNARTRR